MAHSLVGTEKRKRSYATMECSTTVDCDSRMHS